MSSSHKRITNFQCYRHIRRRSLQYLSLHRILASNTDSENRLIQIDPTYSLFRTSYKHSSPLELTIICIGIPLQATTTKAATTTNTSNCIALQNKIKQNNNKDAENTIIMRISLTSKRKEAFFLADSNTMDTNSNFERFVFSLLVVGE